MQTADTLATAVADTCLVRSVAAGHNLDMSADCSLFATVGHRVAAVALDPCTQAAEDTG